MTNDLAAGTNPRVAIQIVLYESSRHLPRLLRALERLDVDGVEIEVRFLNNSPNDGCTQVVRNHVLPHPHAVVDSPRGNLGFGAGHNLLAAADRRSDYLLLLNPDTIPYHDVIQRLVVAATQDPAAGLIEAAQFPIEHQKVYDPESLHTPWCCAACLLVRRGPFIDVGGFDERLFLYCEDVDLSWRFWAAGYSCLYVPTAKCVHVSQEDETGKDRTAELFHMALGDLYLRRKWFDEAEVEAHREHVRVWFGEATAARLESALQLISPPSPAPCRPAQAMLMPDHINYAPVRW